MERTTKRSAAADGASDGAAKEQERLAALARYDVLGTPPEENFDRLTRLAARTLDVPVALVSLVDANRQWMKSCFGFDRRETSRETSFCTHVVQREAVDGRTDRSVMVVRDATEDPRFSGNPFVTGPAGIRFYAGAPLVTPSGYVLGTLCVLDTRPRTLDEKERQTLAGLAETAMDELELRRQLAAREEAEAALRASKEETTDILESIAGAFFALGAEGRFAYVNDQAVETLGATREALLDTSVCTVFPERVAASLAAQCRRAAGSAQPVDTFDMYHPSLERWLEVRTRPRSSEGLSVFFTDITRRKARQKRLRLLNSAVVNANDGVVITEAEPLDAPGPRIVFANEAFCETTGYAQEEVLGRNPRFLQGPHTNHAALGKLRAALEHREPVRTEFINYKKDGTPFWVEMSVTPVTDAGGNVTHFTSVQRDVTERKCKTTALAKSEERFRTVVENAQDIIFQTDAQGRWTLLSSSWEEVTGYAVEESLGQPAWSFLRSDERLAPPGPLHEWAGEDGTFRHEGRLETKSGEMRQVRMNARVVIEKGEHVRGVVGTLSDLTDTRRFEAEQEARERAEELLAAKTSLLNNMSHELRTPLASIIGFAEVLEEKASEAGVQREFAGRIAQSGKRLQDTLSSVLQIAHLDSDRGGTSLNPEPVDVGAFVQETTALHRPDAEKKGLSFDMEPPRASEGEVYALLDEGALGRILDNLIGNAIKFTGEGGVAVRVHADSEQVHVEVEDTGIGIGEAFREHLFKDFQQESSGLSRTHEGSGLGLAIAQRLAELMEGTIGVESQEGEGSQFTLTLPRLKAW